jgi:hypothetical protein
MAVLPEHTDLRGSIHTGASIPKRTDTPTGIQKYVGTDGLDVSTSMTNSIISNNCHSLAGWSSLLREPPQSVSLWPGEGISSHGIRIKSFSHFVLDLPALWLSSSSSLMWQNILP